MSASPAQGRFGLSPNSISGLRAEYLVAADLMERGFWAFHNLMPVGPVDLCALGRNGIFYRVQVTVGHWEGKRRPRLTYDPHRESLGMWNLLAVVDDSDGVHYFQSGSHPVEPDGKVPDPEPDPMEAVEERAIFDQMWVPWDSLTDVQKRLCHAHWRRHGMQPPVGKSLPKEPALWDRGVP